MILLDGKRMTARREAHAHIREQMEFPAWYGNNLDALWDMLTALSEPTCVRLVHTEVLRAALGDYANRLIQVFVEAAIQNEWLSFSAETDEEGEI